MSKTLPDSRNTSSPYFTSTDYPLNTLNRFLVKAGLVLYQVCKVFLLTVNFREEVGALLANKLLNGTRTVARY